MLITRARLVDLQDGSVAEPGDLWVRDGRLARNPGSTDEQVLDLDGRFVIPGLWDAHVHMTQWATARRHLDLSGVASAEQFLTSLRTALENRGPDAGDEPLVATGVRATTWPRPPGGEELDALSASIPVVVLSADLHATWANKAALDRLGMPDVASGQLVEQQAFDVQIALTRRGPGSDADRDQWVGEALQEAASLGVVGITDMEMADNLADWTRRMDAGAPRVRVRASTWGDLLDERCAAGLRTGDVVAGHDLLTQGPLKVISDGSITARTAWCRAPYGHEQTTGRCNVPADQLVDLAETAVHHGIDCAFHAIGDAAVDAVIHAFTESGARGSIEHAQLATRDQAVAMAALGVVASVQPQHLADDRDPCDQLWPGRPVLAFATLRRAGVRLAFGSDAPVAPLNPWLAIERAVTRTGDGRPAWYPEECLDVGTALRSSTGGVSRLVPGAVADLVALDENPFVVDPHRLHTFGAAVTVVGGEVSHSWI